MIRFEDLVEKVGSYSSPADVELLRRAYVFSAFEHKGQVRHSGEPYLVHPLEVANILADDPVFGKVLLDQRADRGLGAAIGRRHRIEPAKSALVLDAECSAKERKDFLARGGGQLIHESRKVDRRHAARPFVSAH